MNMFHAVALNAIALNLPRKPRPTHAFLPSLSLLPLALALMVQQLRLSCLLVLTSVSPCSCQALNALHPWQQAGMPCCSLIVLIRILQADAACLHPAFSCKSPSRLGMSFSELPSSLDLFKPPCPALFGKITVPLYYMAANAALTCHFHQCTLLTGGDTKRSKCVPLVCVAVALHECLHCLPATKDGRVLQCWLGA